MDDFPKISICNVQATVLLEAEKKRINKPQLSWYRRHEQTRKVRFVDDGWENNDEKTVSKN